MGTIIRWPWRWIRSFAERPRSESESATPTEDADVSERARSVERVMEKVPKPKRTDTLERERREWRHTRCRTRAAARREHHLAARVAEPPLRQAAARRRRAGPGRRARPASPPTRRLRGRSRPDRAQRGQARAAPLPPRRRPRRGRRGRRVRPDEGRRAHDPYKGGAARVVARHRWGHRGPVGGRGASRRAGPSSWAADELSAAASPLPPPPLPPP